MKTDEISASTALMLLTGFTIAVLSGSVAAVVEPLSFADYGSGTTLELVSGRGLWGIDWGQVPWVWSDGVDLPLLGRHVSGVLDLQTTAPADLSEDAVATLPIAGTLTLSARDQANGDTVIGTMVLNGSGFNIVDLNASRVTVDEGAGMILAPFYPPGPEMTLTLEEATGVFAYIQPAGDWRLQLAGLYALPLMNGVRLQDNIFKGLGGAVPLIGGLGAFELSGEYTPDESKRAQQFCESGTGIALQFGTGGGLWDQVWGGGPWDWHACPAAVNAAFLGENASGQLETVMIGEPIIDENLVLHFDFNGQITIFDYNEAAPDQADGQIRGDAKGTFVADVNAANTTFDADGNIVLPFGYAVHDAPDALIHITEATGSYAHIRAAGDWAWYVNGAMTIARLPDLPLQQNILAALQQPELLLDAREEFVLTGWYYREQ